jgi:hypothetical protein
MFGKLFKGIGKGVAAVVKVAAPVVLTAVEPASLINLAIGGVLKHKTRMSNGKIPYLNLLASTGVSYVRNIVAGPTAGDWAASLGPALQEGGALMGISTALHQSLKLPIKQKTGRSI